MESSDNEIVVTPVEETEIPVVPNHSSGSGGDGGFLEDGDVLGPIKEEEVAGEMVAVASRKRGRPNKKHVVHETSGELDEAVATDEVVRKRGRGRPRGSSNRTSRLGSGDGNFIPYAVTIQRGEDIVKKVLAFIQEGVQAICVLTASGPVSIMDMRIGRGPNVIRYEGYFELLTLEGSHINAGGVRNDMLMLSATLAYPDGRVFGGAIGGCLIAAAPVQLILGTIKLTMKRQNPRKQIVEAPTHAVAAGNTSAPTVPTHNAKSPDDTEMTPRGLVMSRPSSDDALVADQCEGHHASPERFDQNASQPSDHASLSDDNNSDV